jgi:hypothetical protein
MAKVVGTVEQRGAAVVCDLRIARGLEEDVLRLQVSVDHEQLRVQNAQALEDLARDGGKQTLLHRRVSRRVTRVHVLH